MKVPFVDLTREANLILPELMEVTNEVLLSGNYINGPKVNSFEKEFARYCGVKHSISVGNGSDGLTLIMKALSIGEGDEVICPANSFIASAWTIKNVGAKPVFCDVNSDLLISFESLQKCVTDKTKAIMPVHLTGKLCDMRPIIDFCKTKDIYIIEDSAQAFGASDNCGNKAGSFGIAGSFSLHPLKNLAVYGDGGVITTNCDELAKKLRLLRNHGLINRDVCSEWGFNSRLDELQAGYALVKMKYINKWTKEYQAIASKYNSGLDPLIDKPSTKEDYTDVFHNYVIKVNPSIRDVLMRQLEDIGVQTKIHYPIPLHLQPCSEELGYQEGDIPLVEYLAKSMISLPIYPSLKNEEISFVIESINYLLKELTL